MEYGRDIEVVPIGKEKFELTVSYPSQPPYIHSVSVVWSWRSAGENRRDTETSNGSLGFYISVGP